MQKLKSKYEDTGLRSLPSACPIHPFGAGVPPPLTGSASCFLSGGEYRLSCRSALSCKIIVGGFLLPRAFDNRASSSSITAGDATLPGEPRGDQVHRDGAAWGEATS